MPLTDQQEQFIRRTITPDQSTLSWGSRRVERYLRELQRRGGQGVVHPNLSREDINKRLTEWIGDFDADLQILQEHHRDFETSRAKATGIFRMPQKVANLEERVLESIAPKSYELASAIGESSNDGAEILEATHTRRRVDIVIAETVRSIRTIGLRELDLTDLWGPLEKRVLEQLKEASSLKKASFQVQIETRIVSTVGMDFVAGTVEVSTDRFHTLEGEGEGPGKYQERFRRALHPALAGVDGTDELTDSTLRHSGITKDLVRQFRRLQLPDRLIITARLAREFEVRPEDDELDEELTCRFRGQQRDPLLRKAREYFEGHGTFEGFLTAHERCDPDRHGQGNRHLEGLPGFGESGCSCFVFYPRPERGGDEGRERRERVVIESVKVTLDPVLGVVRGESKEDTAEKLDVVLTEVRNLLPQQPGFAR